MFNNKPTLSVNQRKGRRGRRPLRWLRVGTFLWSREVGGQFGYSFPHPLRHMPRRSFCYRPVGRTVLGAPRLRDRRAVLDADVERDRWHPRFPRRACLASTAQRIQSRGHSPRTISNGRPTFSVHQRRTGVEARPYGWWGGFGVQPALSVIRRRGVGDAAPYGRFVYFALRRTT